MLGTLLVVIGAVVCFGCALYLFIGLGVALQDSSGSEWGWFMVTLAAISMVVVGLPMIVVGTSLRRGTVAGGGRVARWIGIVATSLVMLWAGSFVVTLPAQIIADGTTILLIPLFGSLAIVAGGAWVIRKLVRMRQ